MPDGMGIFVTLALMAHKITFDHIIYYQVCATRFKLEITNEELDDYLDQLNAVEAEFITAGDFDDTKDLRIVEQQGLRLSRYNVEIPEEEVSEDI